jgi:uncharacterized protein
LEETLKLLYKLQTVDSDLDELEEMKGDLPQAVEQLQSEVDALNGSMKEKRDLITASVKSRDKADLDIAEFKEKLELYKKQQYEVRNNKEYDAITKEIDFAENSIKELEKQFETFENTMGAAKTETETIAGKLEEVQQRLKEKQTELAEVSKANEDEELKLKHEREKVVTRLKKDLIAKYDRIRKARDGKAVVAVKRNSCGGCHNKIPPQRILELRTHTTIYTCERCGRILVSPEIADSLKSEA